MAGDAVDICSTAVSVLPKLEPILGAGLALNLAYLNLSIFAYVTLIRCQINKRLRNIDSNALRQVENTPWFRTLKKLSQVDVLENESKLSLQGFWLGLPGWWGSLYNIMFYWRLGRGISVVATAYVTLMLVFGVAHDVGLLCWSAEWFGADKIEAHFYWATSAFLWPIFAVLCGVWVMVGSGRFVRYQLDKLPEEQKEAAGKMVVDTKEKLKKAP